MKIDATTRTAATRCARCTARSRSTSNDPDSGRVWWSEVGVHQNLTFPVQPDPVSGMHCWHQRVRVEKAGPDDRYGDIVVDTERVASPLQGMDGEDASRAGPRRHATADVVRSAAQANC